MDILIDVIVWICKALFSGNRNPEQSAQAQAQLAAIRQRMVEMQRRQLAAQTGARIPPPARGASSAARGALATARSTSPAVRATPIPAGAQRVQSVRRPMPVATGMATAAPVFSLQRPASVTAMQGVTPPAQVQSPLQPGAIAPPPPSPILQSARPATTPSNFVGAAALARWMTPRTLRQQFMLTEIFQPPVALRSEPPGSRD